MKTDAKESEPQINWPVVGIGSSAGGLEALTSLLGGLDQDVEHSFVIIQHLSPHHRSMMVTLLERETLLPVRDVQDGLRPARGVIYVTPENHNVILADGRFRLLTPSKQVVPKPSVNLFFRSLAEELGELAVGVILSGTGSDGAQGVKEIKYAGGTVLVQDPEESKYDGMPRAAIETGVVDLILPAQTIGKRLMGLALSDSGQLHFSEEGFEQAGVAGLINQLHAWTKIDFSGYKESTLSRRVQRKRPFLPRIQFVLKVCQAF
ncbi:CheB methylesterase [Magnetococcus marinus MC-1]|uniref:protein-glutamate methylesterase n=1 Tax=Magnetococcus marinus (strain ATCC BAA-1437 / JCM 17883 / MC-1) TaxID=156889 RepID=A0LAY8_MAGMM|nr:chemotaxis protein CheB [Magnetococcus marinus]ABK45131.1 CheB methylesterase [Magnetococcus marinus MC-1]